ncbi:MAG: transposase [Firmicutes bacterium]|nr:transposase [Bacillota bacterium]
MYREFLLTDINNFPTLVGYIASGLFIVVGLLLIIQNKAHKKALKQEEDKVNNIDNLINNDKNKNKNKEEIKEFDPDSIFKTLPTFSNKNFFNQTEIEVKNKLNLNDIKIIKKEIIDFFEETDKYIIISVFKYKNKNVEKTITVTSENNKNITITNCPNCGGKIKDPTLLRCKHCNSIINNTNKRNNNWTITDIKDK